MIKKTVDKYKQARRRGEQPEISAAEHRANCDEAVSLIMNVVERLPKDAPPVAESMDELMFELKTGMKLSPLIVERYDGRRIKYHDDGTFEIIDDSGNTSDLNTVSDSQRSVDPIGEADVIRNKNPLEMPDLPTETNNLAKLVRGKKFRPTNNY